jgi:hypothetical protein
VINEISTKNEGRRAQYAGEVDEANEANEADQSVDGD